MINIENFNNMEVKFNEQGLIPVIIQDFFSLQILMLGYMNQEALNKTVTEKIVVFFSRSKNSLWKKGETSGNFLFVKEIFLDCDADTLLIKATPTGPTCHRQTISCFDNDQNSGFIYQLQDIIQRRIAEKDENSYTYRLTKQGVNKVAQKVGEEAVEMVIESKDNDDNLFLNESADLLYHYLILLSKKEFTLEEVEKVLKSRNLK